MNFSAAQTKLSQAIRLKEYQYRALIHTIGQPQAVDRFLTRIRTYDVIASALGPRSSVRRNLILDRAGIGLFASLFFSVNAGRIDMDGVVEETRRNLGDHRFTGFINNPTPSVRLPPGQEPDNPPEIPVSPDKPKQIRRPRKEPDSYPADTAILFVDIRPLTYSLEELSKIRDTVSRSISHGDTVPADIMKYDLRGFLEALMKFQIFERDGKLYQSDPDLTRNHAINLLTLLINTLRRRPELTLDDIVNRLRGKK